MATIQEISQLRRDGKIEEAFIQCKALEEQFPDDRFVRTTMAWCVKSRCELAAKGKEVSKFIESFSILPRLKLAEIGELSMPNRFAWDIKTLFEALKYEPDLLVATANEVLEIVKGLQFKTPDKYYTLLADTFLKVKGRQGVQWSAFVEFMDWFGFDNLMPEDFSRIPLNNGKSIPSVAERVHSAYYKGLMAQIESSVIDADRIEEFLGRLTRLSSSHPEYQYTLYHKSLLLLALGRKDEALESIRPFVKKKQNDFWVWDVLCDTTDDNSVKLSCCCRALLCPTDPKFLGKVHIKAAKLMHESGYDTNARTELQIMKSVYQENGWRLPKEATELIAQSWFQGTQAEDNTLFYKEHLSASEEFLFFDTPETAILLTHYNHEKHICNFITEKRERGFFSTKGLKGKFRENDVFLVRLEEKIITGKLSKVLTWKKSSGIPNYFNVFFKRIDGVLRIKQGNTFGFVGDIYVDRKLIRDGMTDGMAVNGIGVLCYTQKKSQFSWKAMSLKPKRRRPIAKPLKPSAD
ncbi:MAG: hypothetical protein HDR88_12195 [Bacteroides sp.]|nr:hypothetical protein [Bacteroides sp.]